MHRSCAGCPATGRTGQKPRIKFVPHCRAIPSLTSLPCPVLFYFLKEFLLDTGHPFDFKNIRSAEELQLLPDYAGAVKWVLVEIDDAVLTVGRI